MSQEPGNSEGEDKVDTIPNEATAKQLKAFIERVERLEEEKAAIGGDVREVYAEAKSVGFDTKAMREIVKLRKQDENERQEHEAVLDTYLRALGMDGLQRDLWEQEATTIADEMAADTTISLNGGPEVPLSASTAREALKLVKGGKDKPKTGKIRGKSVPLPKEKEPA